MANIVELTMFALSRNLERCAGCGEPSRGFANQPGRLSDDDQELFQDSQSFKGNPYRAPRRSGRSFRHSLSDNLQNIFFCSIFHLFLFLPTGSFIDYVFFVIYKDFVKHIVCTLMIIFFFRAVKLIMMIKKTIQENEE